MPNAAETIPRGEWDRFSFEEAAQKNPSVATHRSEPKRLQISKAPVPASTPFTSPLIDPVPLIASRGQVSKVTSSIRLIECTADSIAFPSVYNHLHS
jgi:hypothetical protein